MEFTFNVAGDYKTEFIKYIDLLFEKASTLTQEQRVVLTGQLTEAYMLTTGKRPSGGQLDRLGSFILHEELTDKDPHKASKTGILSDRQVRRREEEKDADSRLADQYGTDGVKHGTGKRNTRTNNLE